MLVDLLQSSVVLLSGVQVPSFEFIEYSDDIRGPSDLILAVLDLGTAPTAVRAPAVHAVLLPEEHTEVMQDDPGTSAPPSPCLIGVSPGDPGHEMGGINATGKVVHGVAKCSEVLVLPDGRNLDIEAILSGRLGLVGDAQCLLDSFPFACEDSVELGQFLCALFVPHDLGDCLLGVHLFN